MRETGAGSVSASDTGRPLFSAELDYALTSTRKVAAFSVMRRSRRVIHHRLLRLGFGTRRTYTTHETFVKFRSPKRIEDVRSRPGRPARRVKLREGRRIASLDSELRSCCRPSFMGSKVDEDAFARGAGGRPTGSEGAGGLARHALLSARRVGRGFCVAASASLRQPKSLKPVLPVLC
jgi:hypothetical protein